MSPCLSLSLFLRNPCSGRAAATDESTAIHGGQPSDFTFATVVYHIQATPPAGEQGRNATRHNCDYIDVSEKCAALARPTRSFLVTFVIEDAIRARVEGRQLSATLCSPCWKRVEDAVREFVFVAVEPATGEPVVARPPSFYKASLHVPQAMFPHLTGDAERDWDTILSSFDAQDHGMVIEILIERGPI
ncbi:hypothetical protein PG993_004259 [Apiospora rasikravindrae]|uniref:Uncharacterized protein n=1 Tax=Apiospora rasikravindrae TaxID=990691 RepID=A0ABR1TC80_9PEZI